MPVAGWQGLAEGRKALMLLARLASSRLGASPPSEANTLTRRHVDEAGQVWACAFGGGVFERGGGVASLAGPVGHGVMHCHPAAQQRTTVVSNTIKIHQGKLSRTIRPTFGEQTAVALAARLCECVSALGIAGHCGHVYW